MSRQRSLQYQQQPQQWQSVNYLEKSVGRLQSTLNALHNTVTMLNASTSDLPRVKHVMNFNRQYEIVTETDIQEAQVQIASDVQPQIAMLLTQAEDMMNRLEREERSLESKVEQQEIALEEFKDRSVEYTAPPADVPAKLAKDKATAAENAKKLMRLRMRRQALTRTIEDRDEEVTRKENELHRLESQKLPPRESRHPTIPPPRLAGVGASSTNASARQQALQCELAEMETQIQNRKKELQTLRRSSLSEKEMRKVSKEDDPRTPTKRDREASVAGVSEPSMDGKVDESQWQKYPSQLALLLHIASRCRDGTLKAPRDALEDLEIEARMYLQQIQRDHDVVTTTTYPDRRTWKSQATAQMRGVCKVLFPENNVGIAMGRVLEILVEGPQQPGELPEDGDEVDLERGVGVKIFAREFPPSQERRHNLQKAIQMLGEFGIVETVMEVVEGEEGEAGKRSRGGVGAGLQGHQMGEMMVRIKGVKRVVV